MHKLYSHYLLQILLDVHASYELYLLNERMFYSNKWHNVLCSLFTDSLWAKCRLQATGQLSRAIIIHDSGVSQGR